MMHTFGQEFDNNQEPEKNYPLKGIIVGKVDVLQDVREDDRDQVTPAEFDALQMRFQYKNELAQIYRGSLLASLSYIAQRESISIFLPQETEDGIKFEVKEPAELQSSIINYYNHQDLIDDIVRSNIPYTYPQDWYLISKNGNVICEQESVVNALQESTDTDDLNRHKGMYSEGGMVVRGKKYIFLNLPNQALREAYEAEYGEFSPYTNQRMVNDLFPDHQVVYLPNMVDILETEAEEYANTEFANRTDEMNTLLALGKNSIKWKEYTAFAIAHRAGNLSKEFLTVDEMGHLAKEIEEIIQDMDFIDPKPFEVIVKNKPVLITGNTWSSSIAEADRRLYARTERNLKTDLKREYIKANTDLNRALDHHHIDQAIGFDMNFNGRTVIPVSRSYAQLLEQNNHHLPELFEDSSIEFPRINKTLLDYFDLLNTQITPNGTQYIGPALAELLIAYSKGGQKALELKEQEIADSISGEISYEDFVAVLPEGVKSVAPVVLTSMYDFYVLSEKTKKLNNRYTDNLTNIQEQLHEAGCDAICLPTEIPAVSFQTAGLKCKTNWLI